MPAAHPPEFRRRAVELARQGDKPLAQLAKDLGVSRPCLQNWISQAADDNRGAGDRLTSAEKKEPAESRRRNKQLEMENNILKRAATYFAGENVLPKQLGLRVETRRGKPRFRRDDTGTTVRLADTWHTGFIDVSGGQGLLGQVEGRSADEVIACLNAQPAWPSIRST